MRKFLPLFLIITFSCVEKPIEIENFDSEGWKADRMGCQNQRKALADILINNKDKLLGNSSQKIIGLLGKPERTELYTRNQRFYIYYITPGPECGENHMDTEHDRLTLRFSATDALKEISLYD